MWIKCYHFDIYFVEKDERAARKQNKWTHKNSCKNRVMEVIFKTGSGIGVGISL